MASEVEVNPGNLNTVITTPQFTLDSVNGEIGSGFDNYVELRGINYNASGGGNWMGHDYVALNAVPNPIPEPSAPLLALLGSVLTLSFLRRRNRG
ncbi:MAG: hypothetical protein GY871_10445 [Actinomycetales bacterium]|nr:hypothetical protein [Actinomycetales bacterium]